MTKFSKGKTLIITLIVCCCSLLFLLSGIYIVQTKKSNNTNNQAQAALLTFDNSAIKGSGTKANPYRIYDGQGLDMAFSQTHGSAIYAVLENDVSFTSYSYGIYTGNNTIILDGNFKRINMNINCTVTKNNPYPVGLFYNCWAVNIKNLYLTGSINVSGYPRAVGSIVGNLEQGATIENCYVNVDITVNYDELSGIQYVGGLFGSVGLQSSGSAVVAATTIKDVFYGGYITLPNYNASHVKIAGFVNQNALNKSYTETKSNSQWSLLKKLNGTRDYECSNGALTSYFFDKSYKEWTNNSINNFVPVDDYVETMDISTYFSIVQISFLIHRERVEDKMKTIYVELVNAPEGAAFTGYSVFYYVDYFSYEILSEANSVSGIEFQLVSFDILSYSSCSFTYPEGWSAYYEYDYDEFSEYFEIHFERNVTLKMGGVYYNGTKVDASVAYLDKSANVSNRLYAIYVDLLASSENEHKLRLSIWGGSKFNETCTLIIEDTKYTLMGWYVETTTADETKKLSLSTEWLDSYEDVGNDLVYTIYPILKLKTYGVEVG